MLPMDAAVVGATGTVGQRLVTLLAAHPWFKLAAVAASGHSAGKRYEEAVAGRWVINAPIPKEARTLTVQDATEDILKIAASCRVAFVAVNLDAAATRALEEALAAAGVAVISNNSAHRRTPDVPIILPEVNADHVGLINAQRARRGWRKGLIVVKPNCTVQSYLPVVKAWESFNPRAVAVVTLQAVSGAGRTLAGWPEICDNVIPFIAGEEEKSEQEPAKILGRVEGDAVREADVPRFTATCLRVPVSDGHLAVVTVEFAADVTWAQLTRALTSYPNPIADLRLPSAPEPFIVFREEEDRPQPRLDRDCGKGMAVCVGRLREVAPRRWRFVALSHNTVRGAAGGAVLTAELLRVKGYLD